MTTTPVHRPTLVTVLIVLIVLSGVFSVISGGMALMASGGMWGAGIVLIVIGLAYLGVAKGLSEGRPAARMIVAVVAAVQAALGLFTVTRTDDGTTNSSAIGSIVIALVILAVLFSPAANNFFGARR